MNKVIYFNSFYTHILKIRNEFLVKYKENDIKKSLLILVKNALKELKDCNWHLEKKNGQTLQQLYFEEEWTLNSPQEKLMLFILLKELKWNIKNCYISWFIEALIFSEANPYNYKNYITMFLDPKVYSLITEIEATELSFILAKLIEIIPSESVVKKDYSPFIYHLSRLTKKKYSPIFQGNYTLENIYCTLKKLMHELNQKYLYFLEKDYQTLNLLNEYQNNLSLSEKEELMKKIENIESNNEKSSMVIIREILLELQAWNNKTRKLIRQQKKDILLSFIH